jgi:hypothetical protein
MIDGLDVVDHRDDAASEDQEESDDAEEAHTI